ncbi:hypothetical protein BJF82_09515 [Kytococcus sp. CUA-901]|nr:hypothetical protein BJF82_09515 [Kytococcus sp. CUA-901]
MRGDSTASSAAATSPVSRAPTRGTHQRTAAMTTSSRSATTPVSTRARPRRPSRAGVSGTRRR